LTIIDTEFYSDEEDSELRKTNSNTPDLFAFDCGQLPFERMGDDHFELLLADLYSAQADDGREDWYDKARRLNDGADQGRDVILTLDSAPVGVIQCKRYNGIVSLDMIIKEICKFFLYATIKPGIASAPGEPFRYYVAVSDRAAGKLFEFLEAKGRQRFDDLRAEFEEKALLVRKGSATLKKHPALKNLTKEQLCDLVWARIDNLQTALHKKDDLSRMVGAYPGIRSTYFRLEQGSADIVGEVKAFLQSRNLVVSDEDQKLIADIRTEYIKLKLGRHYRFQSALVQGEELMPFMRGMLQHKAGTLYDQFGSHPVVLTAGARAATPADWDELNQLVDAYASPAVVFVGCGDVSGAHLNEWKKSDGMIWIDPSWEPAPLKKYRAGWCWVKDPAQGILNCYALVENEPGAAGYDYADVSLRLAFEDVIIWPTLGDDFTNPISRAKSQLRRIMASQKEDSSKRPNLVLGSLNVTNLDKVLTSVSDLYGQRIQSTIAVALANSNRVQACAAELYSATGIFPAIDAEFLTRPTPMAVNPPGRVMRRSSSGALTCTLDWTAELTLLSVQSHRLVAGCVSADMPPASLEFHELFDRYPPYQGYLAAVKKELDLLNTLVQDATLPDYSEFTYRAWFGVRAGEPFPLEQLSSSGEHVMRAVQALSYLNVPTSSQWSCAPDSQAHIRYDDAAHGQVSIMAWSNKSYHVRQMAGDLFDWARQPIAHPSLIVFAQGRGRVDDSKPSHGRYDFTSPPVHQELITEPAIARNVYMFDLSEIESVYDDPTGASPDQFMEEILKRKGKLDAQ
jgi:hypothetical protein